MYVFFSKTFAENEKPNVLFIMVDDLRVELGSYGGPHVKSPNIDKLADSGTRFANAYVSVPVCGASRASLFTGMRALPDRFVRYYTWVQEDAPEAITLFEQFKNNGYNTIGYGKIFHQTQDTAEKSWTSGRAWIADYDQDPKKILLLETTKDQKILHYIELLVLDPQQKTLMVQMMFILMGWLQIKQ